ncbi:ribulose-phosphate 3-epimerase [Holdemania massiliensis]|uniref:Ribulose-phosphate 3-epimerase n=1 Tax=Holdemania massiliensis TaxID=1468449 RepID=A0A6N7SBW3_9FIRM|nr:ribulose-phosphate 3-epimerase [Holdemania massiliensis]MSA72835.1 ribulose-phosphate 3-epimerase [Holdemania massiliensis]MSA91100.1 ribulose-phosphate 3-epimerase [Holdemania massiliensis]MSB79950.1 ribulose-phosphate 3-epimerase [Holdemania massiliensis]MSC34871.1 ribulose-phosphate 3-epimerase [Holdemania massiliensis]MSC41260.1 ribulose-phosphate 3-epimerase [Holdemania massiliensis]
MTIISPSILSLDFTQLNTQMEAVNASQAQWLHYDVMDGHFVPNLTFGPDILKAFRKLTDCELDVHLMITDPETYAPVFIKAGAQWLTFHYEAMENAEACRKLAKQLRQWGVKPGISIKPKTPVEVLKDLWQDFDLVLVMSVEPGFGGQQFDPSALEKIAQLRAWAQAENADLRIEVDGGINAETGKLCKQAGADVLVAGNYIFKNNIVDAVDSLC